MAIRKFNSGGRGMVQWVVVFVLGIAQLGAHAADPDPLQDFCVADLDAARNGVSVNGYPCKDRHLVTSDDFVFTGFRNKGTRISRNHPQVLPERSHVPHPTA